MIPPSLAAYALAKSTVPNEACENPCRLEYSVVAAISQTSYRIVTESYGNSSRVHINMAELAKGIQDGIFKDMPAAAWIHSHLPAFGNEIWGWELNVKSSPSPTDISTLANLNDLLKMPVYSGIVAYNFAFKPIVKIFKPNGDAYP